MILPDIPVNPRIRILGKPGNGKSTLARQLSSMLGMKHLEMDSIAFTDNWATNPEFQAECQKFVHKHGCFVACGNWTRTNQVFYPVTNLFIILDYPWYVTLPRLLKRTFIRVLSGEDLWGLKGTKETIFNVLFDSESILYWWYLVNFDPRYMKDMAAIVLQEAPNTPCIIFRDPSETDEWLKSLKLHKAE